MRHDGREIPSRAIAADGEAFIIDRKRLRMFAYPTDRSRTILDGRRKPVLWCKPVIDRHDGASRFIRQFAAHMIVRIQVADAKPPAMNEN